jgi:hypothetical protein
MIELGAPKGSDHLRLPYGVIAARKFSETGIRGMTVGVGLEDAMDGA